MARFNGSEGGEIPLDEAAAWTANYRKKSADPNVTKAHFFGRDILQKILDQKNCMGIRMYYAIAGEGAAVEEGSMQLILVGADADGNDMDAGVVADRSVSCPPTCGDIGPLNG